MSRKNGVSRRDFVRMGCCTAASFGLTAAIGRLNLIHAYAAPAATDYRALVCIFLFGGNDSNNLIVPNDNAGYQNYAKIRSALALPQTSILLVTSKRPMPPGKIRMACIRTSRGCRDFLRAARWHSGERRNAGAAVDANAISGGIQLAENSCSCRNF